MKKVKPVKKVLVIRFRRVGDAVLTSAVCSSIKKSFPSAEVHFVLNENIAPLFEHHPHIDKLISFSDSENGSFWKYVCKVWQVVHSNRYEMIVDCRSTVKSLFFTLFSLSSTYRLGIQKKYNILSNYMVDLETFESNVDKMVGLLTPLEQTLNLQLVKQFTLVITPEEKSAFKKYMMQQGIDFSKPIIVCAVATRLEFKNWNLNYMAEVLLQVIKNHDNVQLIFNYAGQEEYTIVESVKTKMGNPSQVFLNIEAKNLRELGALIVNSNFLFGNEGGSRHIAQALDVPSLAIFSPRIPKSEWLPNASERFQGLEPSDFISRSELDKMDYYDAFNTLTPENVSNRLFPMLDKFLCN